MDNNNLLENLSNTLSPDNAVRKQSESLLLNQNVDIVPQILSILLNDASLPPQIQLVCLTLIKNRITSDWNSPKTSDDIKNTVKTQIVQFIVNFQNPFSGPNHAIVRMSLKIINIIIFFGSKEFQFDLLNYANNLIAKDVDNFYIGVLFILQVSKYNRNTDNYELMDNISLSFCPVFKDFFDSYNKELKSGVNNIEKKLITHDILKILNYLTTTRISKYFQNSQENTLQSFCNLFVESFFTLVKNEDYENAKWILRFFIKLQIKSNATSHYEEGFTDVFLNTVLPSNISSIMECLSKSYEIVSAIISIDDDNTKERSLYYFLIYITKCLSPLTYKCIEPHLNMIISNIIIRTFSISSDEVDNFTDDAADFINNNISITIMINDVSNSDIKYASSLFIRKLIETNNEFINPLVSLASQILSNEQEDKTPISCALDILTIVESNIDQATLSSAINRIIEINRNITHEQLWLRCLIFEFFSNLKTKDEGLFNHLQDNLSLSLESTQPLPILIASLKLIILKLNANRIDPVQIMQILLSINETEHFEIVNNLIDRLVYKYPQQLIPYSSQLISSLCNSFLHVQDDDSGNEEFDDGSKENKFLAIIDNIIIIILSINDSKSIVEMNDQLNHIISAILDNAILDLVESVMELVEEINIQAKQVLNLETVANSFRNYGFDYFNYYTKYFESVYCYGTTNDKAIVNELIKWIIDENPSELEINEDEFEFIEFLSSVISEMVISSTPETPDNGLSDEVYGKGLQLLFNAFEDKEEFWSNKMVFRCIIGGFLNKPAVAVSVFNGGDLMEEILTRFGNLIEDGTWCTVYDLKLGIVSLLSIIKGCSENPNIKSIAMTILPKLCDKMTDAIEHREKLKNMCGSISTGDDLGEDGEFGFDCDDEEYDELNKVSVLDQIDVFGEVKAFLNNGQ